MDSATWIFAIFAATHPTQRHLRVSDGLVDGIGNGTTGNPSGAVGGGGGGAATFPSDRVGGANRFATSVQISQERFAPGVSMVYLATGANCADALAVGAASGGMGPVLLTQKDVVPGEKELARLRPQRIVVLGGTSAISDAVLNAMRTLATASTTRVGGADRYATAAQVSACTFGSNVEVVYVATGTNFADALAAGGAAQGRGQALLVRPDSIPDATATELARLNLRRIVVLGGVAAVRASVQSQLAAFTGGSVSRVSGADRYVTAAELSRVTFTPGAEVVYVATGINFADALSAAALGAPVLLARPNCIPTSVLTELDRLAAEKIILLGGTSALSDDVRRLTPC